MEGKYELTIGGRLGPGVEDAKEVRCLNRIIRGTAWGVEYAADPRLIERLLEQVNLEGANGSASPGVKVSAHQVPSEERSFEVPPLLRIIFRPTGPTSYMLLMRFVGSCHDQAT